MKCILIALLFISGFCRAQEWQVEVMPGIISYTGDLTESTVSVRNMKPSISINAKYEFYYLVLRGGFAFGQVGGNDKYNKDSYIRNRRLDFKSNIWEVSLGAELNLVEPDLFFAYPYLFAGVGLFHFNPYTYDKDKVKTYLHPLRTEGQGLPEYPKKKEYSLTQFCIPIGAGWKLKLNKKFDIAYEFGYRVLFTDYLDDVSTTYANSAVLANRVGPKSAELALRATYAPDVNYLPAFGDMRGNPDVKDGYFFSGIKLIFHITDRIE